MNGVAEAERERRTAGALKIGYGAENLKHLPEGSWVLGIAYGSAVETGELLQLALDAEIVDTETLKGLLRQTRRTERLLLGMLKQRGAFRT